MHRSTPAEHAQHDLDLIAGHAAGDLNPSERTRADTILQSCDACASVRRDLVAIALATRTLPAPAAAPRDFRLNASQAASLRRGGWLTSLLRPFAAPRSTIRPLATAFTSLGIAGLLVTNILPALFGGAASLAPEAGAAGDLAAPMPAASAAAAATAAPAFPVAQGPQSSGARDQLNAQGLQTFVAIRTGAGGSKSTEATAPPEYAGNEDNASGSGQPSYGRLRSNERSLIVEDQTNPMFIGSLILIALGLGLFGLRFLARRVR